MVIQALQKVFQKPIYISLAFTASALAFAFAVWFPNIRLIIKIIGHPGISLKQKLDLPISLLGGIATNFTLLSASYTIAIALLFGINLAMFIYFLKRRIDGIRSSGIATGFLGIMSGVLGIGCSACGSLLLTSILAFFNALGIISLLPLKGGEFGILGVILLGISLYLTAKQIENPAVCRVND